MAGGGVQFPGRGPREAKIVADEIDGRYWEEFSVR